MNKHQIFQTAILALLTVAVSASEVTLPNEFVAGERARAAEVNENFDAVKEAVDDNHARITALETGTVSVSAHAFDEASGGVCTFKRTQQYGYFQNTDTTCIASAGVSIPDGATITAAGCVVFDNVATSAIELSLIRSEIDETPNTSTIFGSTQTSGDEPILAQAFAISLMGDPSNAVVNNLLYAYSISVIFTTTGLAPAYQDLRLHSCIVSYSLSS